MSVHFWILQVSWRTNTNTWSTVNVNKTLLLLFFINILQPTAAGLLKLYKYLCLDYFERYTKIDDQRKIKVEYRTTTYFTLINSLLLLWRVFWYSSTFKRNNDIFSTHWLCKHWLYFFLANRASLIYTKC